MFLYLQQYLKLIATRFLTIRVAIDKNRQVQYLSV